MGIKAAHLALPIDGRQSPTALAVARGTARLLLSYGLCCVSELPLASGRRADLVAVSTSGEIWIAEIKSSIADFRADQKWPDYRLHCDRLFFATALDVPRGIFPDDAGLIIADSFGASLVREAPEHRLPAAARKKHAGLLWTRRRLAPASACRPEWALWDGVVDRAFPGGTESSRRKECSEFNGLGES